MSVLIKNTLGRKVVSSILANSAPKPPCLSSFHLVPDSGDKTLRKVVSLALWVQGEGPRKFEMLVWKPTPQICPFMNWFTLEVQGTNTSSLTEHRRCPFSHQTM
ncbi:hypothetical protein N665_0022s0026 [Sinapis alba]|nr:hypothetical protein N665_0022s0026 [Sinapis alba]